MEDVYDKAGYLEILLEALVGPRTCLSVRPLGIECVYSALVWAGLSGFPSARILRTAISNTVHSSDDRTEGTSSIMLTSQRVVNSNKMRKEE